MVALTRTPVRALFALAAASIFALPACSTLEASADRARDFASRHPIATTVAAAAVGAGIYALAHHDHEPYQPIRRPEEPYPCARHPGLCD
jgi:hypothetical protein